MLLTEYDEKKHMKNIYKEGYEKGEQSGFAKGEQSGFAKGEGAALQKLIQIKLDTGKSLETIAAELETDIDTVKKLIDKL